MKTEPRADARVLFFLDHVDWVGGPKSMLFQNYTNLMTLGIHPVFFREMFQVLKMFLRIVIQKNESDILNDRSKKVLKVPKIGSII